MKQKIYMSFLEPKFGIIIPFVMHVFSELSVLPVKKNPNLIRTDRKGFILRERKLCT